MVKPYLSRLRPTGSGGLRPRLRSRFEPVPTLPIDGPAIGSLGLGVPWALPAEATDVEVELSPDPPDPYLTTQAPTEAAPADQTVPRARTDVPDPAARDEERAPARAAATPPTPSPAPPTTPPRPDLAVAATPPTPSPAPPTTPPRPDLAVAATPPTPSPAPPTTPAVDAELGWDPPGLDLAGPTVTTATLGDQAGPRVRTGVPEPAALDEGRPPARAATRPPAPSPAPAVTPAGGIRQPMPAGNEAEFRLHLVEATGREHPPAAVSATSRGMPQLQRAVSDQAPVLSGRANSGELPRADPTPLGPAPGERPSPAPYRRGGRTSRARDARGGGAQGDAAQTDRVQAIARWLGDTGAAPAHAGAATGRSVSHEPALARLDWFSGWSSPAAAHTDLTVTIGRIEVKAPAADPAPIRPRSSGPRQRVPSLGDYLEARTRARSRPR